MKRLKMNLKLSISKLREELNAFILLTLSSDGISAILEIVLYTLQQYGGYVVDVSGAWRYCYFCCSSPFSEGVSFEDISKISCLSGV